MNGCSTSKPRHLIIFANGVSGTTALFSQLLCNKHVYQHKNKEPLNFHTSRHREQNAKVLNGHHWYTDHIRVLMDKAEAENKKLVIHIKPSHIKELGLDIHEVMNTLSSNSDFVYVKRLNFLAMLFSNRSKRHYKSLINFNPEAAVSAKIAMDLKVIERLATRERFHYEVSYDMLEEGLSNHAHLAISYEDDICTDLRATVDKISTQYGFYDNYVYTCRTGTERYASKKSVWSDVPLRDKIENFNEVSSLLSGTRHEWMLNE